MTFSRLLRPHPLQQLVVATVATNPGTNGRRHLLIVYGAIAYKNADGTQDGSHIVEGSDIQSPTAAPSSGVGYKRLRFYQMFPRRT